MCVCVVTVMLTHIQSHVKKKKLSPLIKKQNERKRQVKSETTKLSRGTGINNNNNKENKGRRRCSDSK